ncbi:MAG: hypothetical protein RLZZ612_1567 [Pseudomonadota bacterium]|jgi:hypothetical protein
MKPTLLEQQQAFLNAIWQRQPQGDDIKKQAAHALFMSDRGLKAYQINSDALAERVLSAAYPVVTALVSADTMAALARALWSQQPPTQGDLALWGDAFAAWLQSAPLLAELRGQLPYLPDVARLEWALHATDTVADALPARPESLHLLTQDTQHTPARLMLRWAAGVQVLHLGWSVDAIVTAHQQPPEHWPTALAALGETWATATPQAILIGRLGWRVCHQPISLSEAALITRLLQGQDLFAALAEHAADNNEAELDAAHWFQTRWQDGWLLEIIATEEPFHAISP